MTATRFELLPDELRVFLAGDVTMQTTGKIWPEMARFVAQNKMRVVVDAASVSRMDSTGVALLVHVRQHQQSISKQFSVVGLPEPYEKLYHLFDQGTLEQTWEDEEIYWHLDQIGRATLSAWERFQSLVTFAGEITVNVVQSLLRPMDIRWKDFFKTIEHAGVYAIPITMLIGFLLGLILAFQSAIPMRRFGAEIFVANLIGLSVIRELGPLMTAVVLAGRSGSAFAAEIGTMRINEEIDALTTMGFNPIKFLVVPRLLAVVCLSPLLTMFFNLAGLAGGAVVMLSLGFPLVTYVNQVQSTADYSDLLGGLFKALVFGWLVAAIGCYRGLQTRTGASAVGASTTSAVVSGIVLIAVFDGIFSVMFFFMGW